MGMIWFFEEYSVQILRVGKKLSIGADKREFRTDATNLKDAQWEGSKPFGGLN